MKRTFLVIIVLLVSLPAWAQRYLSTFGFSVEIPSYWTVMTRNELRDNPDMLNFDNEVFANTDRELLNQISEMVRNGKIEVYFNTQTSAPGFNDNINVYRQQGRVPANGSELRQACAALPGELNRAFGKPIELYACEFRTVGGLHALYLDFDGVVDGTRSVQYQVDKGTGEALIFTLTTQKGTLATNSPEFDAILGSILLE